MLRALAAALALSVPAFSQSVIPYSVDAGQTTSSLHGGSAGGVHEHLDVTNSVQQGGGDTVTLTVVHFVQNSDGEGYSEETYTVPIPYGQRRTFHGDVKSVTVTAGSKDAKGECTVTYP